MLPNSNRHCMQRMKMVKQTAIFGYVEYVSNIYLDGYVYVGYGSNYREK